MKAHALETLDRILDRGGDPDDVLRSVVRALAAEPGIAWAGIAFLEEGKLTLGPALGTEEPARRVRVPVAYQGAQVGELCVDGDVDQRFLERLASLVSAHVLIGWDTRGERWDP